MNCRKLVIYVYPFKHIYNIVCPSRQQLKAGGNKGYDFNGRYAKHLFLIIDGIHKSNTENFNFH